MRTRHSLAALATTALLLAGGTARADEGARKAFEQGKRLRDEGDCAGAVTAFDRSLASERSIGAFYNLGFCHEQLGHRHEAYDAYTAARELASQKRDGRLREISGALAALLESPHIRLVLPQPLPDGLQLRVDDELVPSSTYAAETVVFTKSNRSHVVIVRAPGYEERRVTVETKQVAPVELQRLAPAPVVTAPPPAPEPAPIQASGWSTQKTVGVVLGGAGLLAGGAAAFLFTRHVSQVDARKADLDRKVEECDGPACAQNEQVIYNADITTRNRNAWLTIGGTSAVAVGLLVTGIVLFVRAPSAPSERKLAWQVAPQLGPTTRGAVLSRAF